MSTIDALIKRAEKLLSQVHGPGDARPDLSLYTHEQLEEQLYQLRLENALSEGDTAEADKLRRRHGTPLEQLIQMFLNLDLSSLSTDCNAPGPQVQEGSCFYSMTRTNYRYIQMMVECGRVKGQKDDMWRWIDFIEERTGYA